MVFAIEETLHTSFRYRLKVLKAATQVFQTAFGPSEGGLQHYVAMTGSKRWSCL
jgi:hypothetical protein